MVVDRGEEGVAEIEDCICGETPPRHSSPAAWVAYARRVVVCRYTREDDRRTFRCLIERLLKSGEKG